MVPNLSGSSVDVAMTRAQSQDRPVEGLKEVFVIDGEGSVISFYP
ncbi:hypothetical protein [Streptomyces sp. 8L]|nr:hypothetical protein [Streptomyces sp. 8L]